MSGVRLIEHRGIAELRLDNPAKRNALTPEMLTALAAHCDALDRRDGLRAVVVTAEGNRAFCAGADVDAWGDLPPDRFARRWVRDGHRVFDRLARLPVPTVAALSGDAIGGGLELAAACDLRVMAPNAAIALPEARIGVVPGWSGLHRLGRLLPEPALKEMALFGRRIDAPRAVAMGFAAEIATDARRRAFDVAAALDPLSSRAVEAAKWMIHAAAGEDRAAAIDALASGLTAAAPDRAEGVAAFRARRPPVFPGG